jgi:hypothetical protein
VKVAKEVIRSKVGSVINVICCRQYLAAANMPLVQRERTCMHCAGVWHVGSPAVSIRV